MSQITEDRDHLRRKIGDLKLRLVDLSHDISLLPRSLTQARRERGLSQAVLARELNVSQSAITDWERGRSRPRVDLRPQLVALLGISNDLFARADWALEGMPVVRKELTQLEDRLSLLELAADKPSDRRYIFQSKINYRDLFRLIYQGYMEFLRESGLQLPPQDVAYLVAQKWSAVKFLISQTVYNDEGDVDGGWTIEKAAADAVAELRISWLESEAKAHGAIPPNTC